MKESITKKHTDMSSLQKIWMRVCVLVVMAMQVTLGMSQNLTVDGYSTAKVCPGEPIVLQATSMGSGVTVVDVYKSENNGAAWNQLGSVRDSSGVFKFVADMGNQAVSFKIREQNPDKPQSQLKETNIVKVEVETECAKKCHQTSTGEYFNGTDFNVIGGGYGSSVSIGGSEFTRVENYFSDYDVTFTPGQNIGGAISNDFSKYFGNLSPSASEGGYSNYYWFSAGGDINYSPFHFKFQMYDNYRNAIWDEKYYRMIMRVYFSKPVGCTKCDASVKLETNEGSQGNFYQNADHADVLVYDDQTNNLLFTESTNKSFDFVHLKRICQLESGKLYRMDIHFYGKFTLQNKNAGATFTMKPRFEQWGCMNMAVDYVSAEIMSVCMDNSAACIGESVSVVAAGFPFDSQYKWEKKNEKTGIWEDLVIDGFNVNRSNLSKVDIPVRDLGKGKYRVYDSKTVGQSSEYIEFDVTGKNCEPVQPTEINGPANPFCIPNTKANGKFSVFPMDANLDVRYTWNFTTPSGKTFGSEAVQFDGGDLESDTRGGSVYLMLNGEAEEGEYTVTVQPIKKMTGTNGDKYDQLAGSPISKKFTVYKTPSLQVIKEGTDPLHQDEVELCPTDKSQMLVAIANRKDGFTSQYVDRYKYTWIDGATGVRDEAVVKFPEWGSCDGTYKEHTASVTVEINGVGCPSTASTTWKLGKIVPPKISCPANKNLTYTLSSTQKTYDVPWTFPDYTAGCETDPALKIELNYRTVTNEVIKKEINTTKSKIGTITPKTFSLPAGTGAISYTVTDGCGNYDLCVINVTVKDVTPINLDCNEIPSYETQLTLQEGCDAEPDYHSTTLPTIQAPQLEDKNGVDGVITGVYMGRVTNPHTIPSTESLDISLFDNKIGLNENYLVGTTYILWLFEDPSGNKAYCIQKVVVIDNLPPTVTCVDPTIGDVKSVPGECGLSVQGLFSQMKELPSAVDVCSGAGAVLTAEIYYRRKGVGSFVYVPQSDFDKIIFDVDKTYEIRWRFYKINNKNVYKDCEATFTVNDEEPPYFDCSLLESIRVTANSYKPQNESYKYLEYASKDSVAVTTGVGPQATTVYYTGTLAEAFASNRIRMIDPSEVTDNCGGDVTIVTTLSGPDANGNENRYPIDDISDLENHKFYVGLNTITYQFLDENGNSSSCTQDIIVTAGTTPIPDCPSTSDTTIYVNDQCQTVFVLNKTSIPTAMIPVNQEGVWFNFRNSVIKAEEDLWNSTQCERVGVYFPDHIVDLGLQEVNVDALLNPAGPGAGPGMGPGIGPGATGSPVPLTIDLLCEHYATDWAKFEGSQANKWNTWNPSFSNEKILSKSNSLTTVTEYKGYPYEVELVDSAWNTIAKVSNPYLADDKAPTRIIAPRWFKSIAGPGGGTSTVECVDSFYACSYASIKLNNNFNDEIIRETLTKGVYSLIYRFQNEEGGIQLDSCVINIHVNDTIAPVLSCGDWSKSGTFTAGADCYVPVDSVVWFKKPTPEDVVARDNCTKEYSDFTVSWRRSWGGYVGVTANTALTDAFPIGKTTMEWVIKDASGNEATCVQTIEVVDKTGPAVDCSKLKTIYATTETNCEASAESVIRAGLSTPYTEDDACSPTGGRIAGEGTRDDGKDVFTDPYPRGTTTITWVFRDSLNNTSQCTQKVVVTDETDPVFDDCDNLESLTIELPADLCVAPQSLVEATLGSHTATDDCDGDIPGVPHVLQPDSTLSALYSAFQKDTTYIIVWTFTDQSGNSISCSQKLTIKDVTPPYVEDVCKDPEKDVDATDTCSVPYDKLGLPTLTEMTLNDQCDGSIVPRVVAKIAQPDHTYFTYEGDELLTLSYPVTAEGYPHKIWWIYVDKANNKDTCQMLINIKDKILPVLEDCDVNSAVSLTVSADICAIEPEDVKKLIVEPKAHDECDDYLGDVGQTWIEPVVERYYIDSTCTINGADTTCVNDTILTADGVRKFWDEDVFIKGRTLLRWVFTDKSGNQIFCEKTVDVLDHTAPYFDCDKIDPDTLRPEAPVGSCEVDFKFLKENVLNQLAYKAYDACTEDSIPGVLTLNGTMELPDEYTMEVGVTYKLLWLFKDEDGNKTTCPQWILPSHTNPLNVDCSLFDDTVHLTSAPGTCEVNQDTLLANLVPPSVTDACRLGTVVAEPFFSTQNGLVYIELMNQKFTTGDTTIHWRFISPWNLHDTAWCQQVVSVKGNKHFDLDCGTLTPTLRDTLVGCGPTDPLTFVVDTPRVADPCITNVDDPNYWRIGVGTRSDSEPLNIPYPLGVTKIQWVFSDFTNSVHDTCIQDIVVKTSQELIFNCDSLNKDTIKVDVDPGECTVDASIIKDKIVTPFALHPCPTESGVDTIWGVPSRKFGMSMDSSYYVGLTEIIWTFIDTSATVLNDTVTCSQWIQVGDVNQMPVKCEDFPDRVYRLNPNDCEISWKEMDIDVPGVVDLCSHEIIDPVVTRSSGRDISVSTKVENGDTIVTVTAADFMVGVDTIKWNYTFHGQQFLCEQIITVKDSMKPIFDCASLEDITVPAISGTCEAESSAIVDSLPKPWPAAEEYCTKQPVLGRVYLEDGRELTATSSFKVSVGSHQLMWVFKDSVINELGDTCYQNLIIQSNIAPVINCDTIPLDTFIISGCDTILGPQAIHTPVALDSCTKDTIYGVGFRLDGRDLYNEPYRVGTTLIRWTFTSPYSSEPTICVQPVVVLTNIEPKFNCADLDTIRLKSEPGECYANLQAVLRELTTPVAVDSCTGTKIRGKYSSVDGGPLPSVFNVGDTTLIKWTFIDSSINAVAKICYQPVLVTGDKAPIFDCDTFSHDTILIEGCDTTLDAQTIHTPIALDACTGDTVYGQGHRLDNGSLYGIYPVGTTTIRWTFISPFSSVSDSCDQQITILTKQEIDFNCEDLNPDTFKVEKGECTVLVELPTHVGKHPCPEQSGVTNIDGIPSLGENAFELSEDGTTWSRVVPTGVWKVKWTFTDTTNTLENPVKVCEQTIVVGDVNDMPVKCENYPDTIIVLPPTDCEITWAAIGFVDSVVVDLCSGDTVVPVITRWSGKTMDEPFTVGIDTIYRAYSYAGQDVLCKQMIDILDSVAPAFDCSQLEPIEVVAPKGVCEVSSELLQDSLGTWYATDSCTDAQVKGVAYVNGIEVKDVTAKVGDTLIVHWVFIDSTLNAVAKECDQTVTVIGQNEPIFDCKSLSDLTFNLHVGDCAFPGDSLNLEIPIALDTCTQAEVPGVASRQDGLSMQDSFALGETMIDWTFKSPYSTEPKVCSQKIIIVDKNPPVPDCAALKDTVKVRITDESESETQITYEELLKAKDFEIPSMIDLCDDTIIAVGVRGDGKKMEDPYPLGTIDIDWVYTDKSGNSATCHQVILVEDYLIDTLYCPAGWNRKTISCADELPKVYETFQEFEEAGGRFSNPAKIKEGSFRMTETFDGTQYCDETYYRTYHVLDVRSNDITCTDTIFVKDNQAPTFTPELKDITIACTDTIPSALKVEISDCDPNPTLTYKEESNQGSDPSKCDYYTYDITRKWVAVDRCGNRDSMIQVIHVVDTVGPTFNFPDDWKDQVLSIYRKGCIFEVPDFSVSVAAIVKDNCSDVSYLKIEQNPVAGAQIKESTDVVVRVSDMCGNKDSLFINVYVPRKKDVVELTARDTTACVSDEKVLNLNTQAIRFAKGKYLQEDDWDHTYHYYESTFYYDIFKGKISDSTVVFSTNPYTYFNIEDELTEVAPLTRMSMSDRYYFIAYDTTTLCADTAYSKVVLKERPRISLESVTHEICELVHVDSTLLYDYLYCTNNMGGDTVISEGWMYKGEKFDLEKDTIPYSSENYGFIYYMENECGLSTSADTYVELCGDIPRSHKDSIARFGSEENLVLLNQEKLKSSDSITMNVHKRFLPQDIFISTEPHDPPRIWLGEVVELQLNTAYSYTSAIWYKVVGEYDRRNVEIGKDEKEFEFISENDDEIDKILYISTLNENPIIQDMPEDTSLYYVTLSDGVCPSVASDLVQVNVITKLPTAFTPYDKDGLNDIFMERHSIIIYDRYGSKVFEGSNGWDGTHRGEMADPGVYYYVVTMKDGSLRKGTIEIIYLNKR